MILGQQHMSILGFLSTARFSIKLLMGICLLTGLPAAAQTFSPDQSPVLIAQNLSLREGNRGPAVSELQRRLGSNGLFPAGAVDGVYGPATTQAVRQFQRIRRLNVTGVADAQTLDLLGVTTDQLTSGLSHPVHGSISSDRITASSSRDDIRTLQRVMRSFGFGIAADGDYGARTVQAVRAYQRTADLPVDGIADRATLLNMGFDSSTGGNGGQSAQGRYVAAVIAGRSELSRVRQSFPNATVASNGLGDYISLGRYVERSDAAARVDIACDRGYEERVLRY